jgi:hypothetical protein
MSHPKLAGENENGHMQGCDQAGDLEYTMQQRSNATTNKSDVYSDSFLQLLSNEFCNR